MKSKSCCPAHPSSSSTERNKASWVDLRQTTDLRPAGGDEKASALNPTAAMRVGCEELLVAKSVSARPVSGAPGDRGALEAEFHGDTCMKHRRRHYYY